MNVWLTPSLQPFVGGTYFPPEDGLTRVGFRTVLTRICDQVGGCQGGKVLECRLRGPCILTSTRMCVCVLTSCSGNRIRTPFWKTVSASPQPCWPDLRSAWVTDRFRPLLPP